MGRWFTTLYYLREMWCNETRQDKNHRLHINALLSNFSPLSAAYVSQWIGSALVQIMVCRLFGAKPLCKPLLQQWRHKLQWNVNRNSYICIQGNAFENDVCEMGAILFRGRWVKDGIYRHRMFGHLMACYMATQSHYLNMLKISIPGMSLTITNLNPYMAQWRPMAT